MAWFREVRSAVARGAAAAFDVLLPPRCAACGADMPATRPGSGSACAACSSALCRDGARCPRCGAPGGGGAEGACRSCRARRPAWAGIVVLGPYADELRAAVLRAKRPAGERLAATLGTLLVDRHRDTLAAWAVDVIVPVPMHWLRRAVRGTSSAGEIARGVAGGLCLPCRGLLRRSRATTMQNRLPVEDRRGNVHGAFRAGRVAGLRVLLIDDVTTTGATLAACTEAALSAGAAEVYAAVVARADGEVHGDA